ncbi:hypothetical protein PG999_012680 [Apiospora kogelbergensis]|uniref:Uncharacterized protein n=1 Tax=Apiospora kogelbergensis TaxID=1337665 RepID=A0AAW0QIK2_9PEZI
MTASNPRFTVQSFLASFWKGMSKIGRQMLCPRNYKTWLADVGSNLPLSLGRLGQYALVNLTEGARDFSWKALGFAGLGAEEEESLIAELRRDAGDPLVRNLPSSFAAPPRRSTWMDALPLKKTLGSEYGLKLTTISYVVYARKPHAWAVEKNEKTQHQARNDC